MENPLIKAEIKFISKENLPILDQLIDFAPTKRVDFTALKYLTDVKDIKRFFEERVAQVKQDNPNDKIPEETVRADLAYISGYGEDFEKGFVRFNKVLVREFTNATTAARSLN